MSKDPMIAQRLRTKDFGVNVHTAGVSTVHPALTYVHSINFSLARHSFLHMFTKGSCSFEANKAHKKKCVSYFAAPCAATSWLVKRKAQ
jgi:hypothetical protein